MILVQSKLKNKILKILKNIFYNHELSAREGAVIVFDSVKTEINEEIYVLYIDSCEKEFFRQYIFEEKEPYIKGYMEARYFLLRKFNISFCDFFSFSVPSEITATEKAENQPKCA